MKANEGTLRILTDLRERAKQDDADGFLLDRLRQLVRNYAAWLSGEWQPTPEEADGYFVEDFAVAVHYAHEAGLQDVAATLVALRGGL